MATRKILPPLKHTTFDEVRSDGTVVVSNEWYDWALNIGRYVDEIRTILDNDNDDQNVTINDLLTADVPVFAPQMTPTITDGCDPLVAIEFAPTAPNLYALQFLPGVDTSADFHAMLPFYWAGKTFTVWVYWGHGSGGTAFDVLWEIDANSTYDNEPITLDFIGGIGAPDTGGTAGNLYIARSGSVPIASYQNQEGSLASLRLTRRGTYTEDTMDITAYVMAVRFVLEGLPIPDPPPITLKWNSADAHADIVLSNSDLTAAHSVAAFRMVRANISKSTGKWYFEVTFDTLVNFGTVGLANATQSLADYVGGSANSWSTGSSGPSQTYYNGSSTSVTPYAISSTERVDVAWDADAGYVWFRCDGNWIGASGVDTGFGVGIGDPATGSNPRYTGVTGTLFPACAPGNGGQITINSTLVGTIPSGFSAWQ